MSVRVAWVLGCFAVASIALASQAVRLAELAKDNKKFDGKEIKVTGKVEEFRQRTSRSGNPYATFVLADGKAKVNVYARGEIKPALKNGDQIEIVGKYRATKKVGTRTFTNEIELDLKKNPIARK